MDITIKKNKEDKVLEFANNAISLFKPNSTTLNGTNFHKFNQYIYTLSNLIEIQDFRDFGEKTSLIIKAIYKSNGSLLNSEDFENNLINIKKEVLDKKRKYFTSFFH